MWFDIDAAREQCSWSDVASQFAQECIARLDAGEDARNVQYPIVRGRAPGLSWAYGDTSATVSRYVEPTQSEPPVGRERVRARVLHGGKFMEASSSSSQVMSAGTSGGRTGRRRVAVGRRCGGGLSILTLSFLWLSMRTAAVLKIREIREPRVTCVSGGGRTWLSGSYNEWMCLRFLRRAWIGIGRLRRVPRNSVLRR